MEETDHAKIDKSYSVRSKKNFTKRNSIKSRINRSNNLRSSRLNAISKTFQGKLNTVYDRYLEFSNSNIRTKNCINPIFIPTINQTTVINQYDKIKRDLVGKDNSSCISQLGNVRLINNPLPTVIQNQNYTKYERSNVMLYDPTCIKVGAYKKLSNSNKRFGQPLIIKKIPSNPIKIKDPKTNVYYGYNKYKAEIQKQKQERISSLECVSYSVAIMDQRNK